MNIPHRFLTTPLIALLLVMVGGSCAPVQKGAEPVPPAGSDNETVPICSLDARQIGYPVTTSGAVVYQDPSQPGGAFFLLENQSCQVGVFIDQSIWNSWENARQREFDQGSKVEVTGELARHQGELVIDILPGSSTIQGEEGSESRQSPDLELFDLCSLDPALDGTSLRVEGWVAFLDENAADGGVYLDLEEDGCQVGSWIAGNLGKTQSDFLELGAWIYLEGTLHLEGGEYFLEVSNIGVPSTAALGLDPGEQWWARPQTFHEGEGPGLDLIPQEGITVLHDWGSLLAGFADQPDQYWSESAIRARWENAHAAGMRVEAVLSILDMFFVTYSPDDEISQGAAIDLYGEPVQYHDPEGFVGCTNRHAWQEFTRQKIFAAIDWGVDGIIIDDFEGSSRWTSGTPVGVGGSEFGPGGCFCPECEAGFREYLQEIYTTEELQGFGITDIESFDYSDYLIDRGWTPERLGQESLKFSGWDSDTHITAPLYEDYADFQNQEVLDFLLSLKEDAQAYARDNYGKQISWSVNSGEFVYGAHKFYDLFDRDVGEIHGFGIPPRGAEGYMYRLSWDIFHNPRLRAFPLADPMAVALLNEYQATNLWGLKGVEAYANQGALIEADYFISEGEGDEVEEQAVKNDPELKYTINSFYLENSDVTDPWSLNGLARVAVLYSSPAIHFDLYRHLQTFRGVCEILTDLGVQFDPLFIGDGLSYTDNLDQDLLSSYDLVFLPNLTALTQNQMDALLKYQEAGGNMISLGKLGEVDQFGAPLEGPTLEELISSAPAGGGSFTSLYSPVIQLGGIRDEELSNEAAFYYQYYIENDPAWAPFLDVIGEAPGPQLSEDAAQAIRDDFDRLLDQNLESRLLAEALPPNIGVQAYSQENPSRKMILHLINYNYDLQSDRVLLQDGIEMAVLVPDGREISNVSLRSPDFDGVLSLEFAYQDSLLRFSVPSLLFWDVVVIE